MAGDNTVYQRQARWAGLIGAGAHYIALLTIASMMVLPLVWMVSTYLKPRKEVFAYPPHGPYSSFHCTHPHESTD